jgi:hypothetical protein
MTYEETPEGSTIWKPLYKCLWHKDEATWQSEESIPAKLLDKFKLDKSHFMTEGEFHKRRVRRGTRRGRRSTSSTILKKTESHAQIVPPLCAYELKRKENMENNKIFMDNLGIESSMMAKSSSIKRKHSTNMGSVPEPEKRQQPDRACKFREPENSQSDPEREEENDDEEIEVDDEEAEESEDGGDAYEEVQDDDEEAEESEDGGDAYEEEEDDDDSSADA